MLRSKRAIVRVVAAGLLCCSVVAVLLIKGLSPLSQPIVFQDGTKLYVRTAKVGYTNEFRHGNKVERLLGNVIGTNGWTVGKWSVSRPELQEFGWITNGTSLTVEFQLVIQSNRLRANPMFKPSPFFPGMQPFPLSVNRKYRILHWGDPAFPYVEEYQERYFRKYRDGYFGYFTTSTFDRLSKDLHVEVQERETKSDEWKSLGVLSFPNPGKRQPESWAAEPFPITNTYGDLTVVLGAIQVQEPRDNSTPYPDIWKHAIQIPLKFVRNGEFLTNWGASDLAVYDASGNYNRFGAFKSVTNGWVAYQAWRSANPSVAWKLIGHLSEDSNFGKTNLFTFSIPFPLNAPAKRNLGELELTLELVNENMLSCKIPEVPDKRLIFVDAFDEIGASIKEWGGSYGQHSFSQQLKLGSVQSNIVARVAVVRDYQFEFLVKPRLVQQFTALE